MEKTSKLDRFHYLGLQVNSEHTWQQKLILPSKTFPIKYAPPPPKMRAMSVNRWESQLYRTDRRPGTWPRKTNSPWEGRNRQGSKHLARSVQSWAFRAEWKKTVYQWSYSTDIPPGRWKDVDRWRGMGPIWEACWRRPKPTNGCSTRIMLKAYIVVSWKPLRAVGGVH